MGRLDTKIIVVTGGCGLLGTAFRKSIQLEGGIAINADISCEKNLNNNEYYCDITNEDSIIELIDNLKNVHKKIDGWVNNAYPRTSDFGNKIEDFPYSSWQKNIDMHLNGYYLCCKLILEEMKKKESGSLINIASIYGVNGPDFTVYEGTSMTSPVAYAAIKGAIINLTKYLASYYGSHNIRVNCISPGGIFDHQNEIFVKQYEKKVPLKRMANPNDISPSVSFLLSDDASYITGHNLIIDGGWCAI